MRLFADKINCCNCGGCEQACPKQAISIKVDNYGFKYPVIDHDKCIDCGICQKVCAFQHIEETNNPINVYVASSNNKRQLRYSASGGIFAALATYIISIGGIVYGACIERVDNKFVVSHKSVSSIEELRALQGSKYVQSDIGNCFKEIRNLLNNGSIVLFSGTPCQCAGLKSFLRKEYSNLYIIDLICHGVPSLQFFNDYIDYKFSNLSDISNFAFRDKTSGWELKGRLDYGEGKCKSIIAGTSSFYSLFLDAQIYRTNCYSCKYASQHRPGDLTIGDYWGIQREHPELIGNKRFCVKDGISCIISNTVKGEMLLTSAGSLINLEPSTYEKVARMGKYRNELLELYCRYGYKAVSVFFYKKYKLQIIVHFVFNMLPFCLKDFLRRIKHQ